MKTLYCPFIYKGDIMYAREDKLFESHDSAAEAAAAFIGMYPNLKCVVHSFAYEEFHNGSSTGSNSEFHVAKDK